MTIVCIVAIAGALASAGYAFPKIVLLLILLAVMLGGILAPCVANTNVPTQGTLLVHGTAGGTPATAFAGIDAIRGFPELKSDEYETTRIDQADAIRQFAASLADPGTLQLTLGFVKANITTLYTNFRVLKSWKITFQDGSTLQFDGYISKIGKAAAKGNEVKVETDIRVSGPHTFTAAP